MKIAIRNFQKKVPIYPARIKKTILKVLSKEKTKKSGLPRPCTQGRGEITVCFVNGFKIKQLNKKYHHVDSPTDVLTFDVSDPEKKECLFADIIVCADTAVRNAKIYKTSTNYELNLYVIHGALHLLGYDDLTAKQAQLMRKKEIEHIKFCLAKSSDAC